MRLTLVCVVGIDVGTLKETAGRSALTELPDRIDAALLKVAPGALDPEAFFIIPPEVVDQVVRGVDRHALNYHTYAVEKLGEKCVLADCQEHKEIAQVLPLFPEWQQCST